MQSLICNFVVIMFSKVGFTNTNINFEFNSFVNDGSNKKFSKTFKCCKKEEEFFLKHWPIEWVNVTVDLNDKIKLNLPKWMITLKKVIYIWENRLDVLPNKKGICLIGKTGGTVQGRISNYLSQINKKEKNSPFLNDIREEPLEFRFGILYHLSENESLVEYETKFNDYWGRYIHLYNQKGGSAGGGSRAEEIKTDYWIVDPEQVTPEKKYFYRKTDEGKIKLDITPGLKRKLDELEENKLSHQGFLYRIKFENEIQENPGYYYGGTINPIERARNHGYVAQSSDKEKGVQYVLNNHTENCNWGLVPIYYTEPSEEVTKGKKVIHVQTLGAVENVMIIARNTLHKDNPHGLNLVMGNGGPIGDVMGKSTSLNKSI